MQEYYVQSMTCKCKSRSRCRSRCGASAGASSIGAFAGLVVYGVGVAAGVSGAGQSRWCRVGTGVRSWVGAGGVDAGVGAGVVGVQK